MNGCYYQNKKILINRQAMTAKQKSKTKSKY